MYDFLHVMLSVAIFSLPQISEDYRNKVRKELVFVAFFTHNKVLSLVSTVFFTSGNKQNLGGNVFNM